MEIPATRANLAQVKRARDGGMVEITSDVCNVANDLRAIRSTLRLRYSEAGEYFVVYDVEEAADGQVREHLVTTAMECDQRLVKEVARIASESYDLVAELDRLEDQGARDREHAHQERVGAAAEKLHHALRDDLGVTDRIYLPASVERALGRG